MFRGSEDAMIVVRDVKELERWLVKLVMWNKGFEIVREGMQMM